MLQNTARGLLALLFVVLELTRPGRPTPLRPICDGRVLNPFITEAQDAHAAMRSCREGCGLSTDVTVPQTKVNFDEWEKKSAPEQIEEVQSGLWLLQQAFSFLRTSVTNTALHGHIDNSLSNLLSIKNLLRRHNIQEYTTPASTAELKDTWTVSSAADVLQNYIIFLRGKVQLLLSGTQACRPDGS
ncbi:erythropoietin isoform X1 [Platichthys flesus]|uniref:erythropoietin isoform X1 n=1 Tax=Platichthys flesus TaxID=8260 RepID=UPI001A88F32B|nr:erythropoietin isoform X1 [Platichthys flesus]